MKILRIYSPLGKFCENLGDNIVEIGARRVIDVDEDSNTMAIVGTPWFWDGCHSSAKYSWLENQLDAYPEAKFIAVGIGSCLALRSSIDCLLGGETAEACKRIWSRFKKITVRDPLTFEFLTAIGIECKLLPCPSVLYPLPEVGSTPGTELFIDAPCWHAGMENERGLIHAPGGDRFNYQPGPCDRRRLDAVLSFFMGYESIVSARVHALMPLIGQRTLSIIPLDSRVLTATHLGVPAWPEEPKLTPLDLVSVQHLYREFLV